MGFSALARRAAPASRARMPGSLSSRRWPTAPPWRRPPTTSDVPICTLSSLGSRRVREEFKRPSRPGSQPTSRTGPRTCGCARCVRLRRTVGGSKSLESDEGQHVSLPQAPPVDLLCRIFWRKAHRHTTPSTVVTDCLGVHSQHSGERVQRLREPQSTPKEEWRLLDDRRAP